MKIDHIGIAVRNLAEANATYERLLGNPPYKMELLAAEGVHTAFFAAGESKIELLESTHDQSPIARFLERKGEGIHHIAFEVSHIGEEIQRLKGEGFSFIQDTPRVGADRKLICFLYPRDAHGVLVELCQSLPD